MEELYNDDVIVLHNILSPRKWFHNRGEFWSSLMDSTDNPKIKYQLNVIWEAQEIDSHNGILDPDEIELVRSIMEGRDYLNTPGSYTGKQVWSVRQNKKIMEVFSSIYNTNLDNLLVGLDPKLIVMPGGSPKKMYRFPPEIVYAGIIAMSYMEVRVKIAGMRKKYKVPKGSMIIWNLAAVKVTLVNNTKEMWCGYYISYIPKDSVAGLDQNYRYERLQIYNYGKCPRNIEPNLVPAKYQPPKLHKRGYSLLGSY